MKKLFTLFMAVAMTCSAMAVNVWDGTSEPWTDGSGTADDPYLIETAANLAYLAEKVNEGYQAVGMEVFKYTYFKMTDDLDLNNINWTPIGNVNMNMEGFYFAGIFDGGYHNIDHLRIQSNVDVCGLFGGLGGEWDGASGTSWGIIRGLSVTNGNITSTGTGAGGIVGVVAGYAWVDQCSFSGTITINNSGSYCGAGGVVAAAAQNSYVRRCSFSGSINASNSNFMGAAGAGGVVGIALNDAHIQWCYNTGSVTGSALMLSVAAGILGATLEDNNVKINGCYNVGTLNALTTGGVFGMISPINPMKGKDEIQISYCYYLNTCGGSNQYGTSMTSDEMKTDEFVGQLNQNTHFFIMDNGSNNGYPVLSQAHFGALGVSDITCYSAKLFAEICQCNDTIVRVAFQYRVYDSPEWIEVEVSYNSYVEAEIYDLEPETDYEYCLLAEFAGGGFMYSASNVFVTEVYDVVSSQELSGIQVYPNPATDVIHIQGVEASEVQVLNTMGQLIKTVRGTNEINVGDLTNGHYLLRITSANPLTVYVLPLSKHSH